MRVYVLIDNTALLIGVYTSPVDAAEMQKRYPYSTVTACRLNSEARACAASGVADAVTQVHKS